MVKHVQTHARHSNVHIHTRLLHTDTDRLCRFDSHKAVVPFLPADVAEGSVVCDVLGNVGDLMDRMVVLEDLMACKTQEV